MTSRGASLRIRLDCYDRNDEFYELKFSGLSFDEIIKINIIFFYLIKKIRIQAGPEFLAQLSQLQHGLMSIQRCEHCQITFPDPIQNSLHVSTITFFSLKRVYINFFHIYKSGLSRFKTKVAETTGSRSHITIVIINMSIYLGISLHIKISPGPAVNSHACGFR